MFENPNSLTIGLLLTGEDLLDPAKDGKFIVFDANILRVTQRFRRGIDIPAEHFVVDVVHHQRLVFVEQPLISVSLIA